VNLQIIGEAMKKHDDQQPMPIPEEKPETEQKIAENSHEEEITVVTRQGEEWKEKYLRALADYQNLQRRTSEEVERVRAFASEVILDRLFPVVDTFEKAAAHVKDPGLTLALKELMAVIEEQGVKRMSVVGKVFDPHTMECIEVVEGDDGIVMHEILPGYMLNDKVLRVAQVKVGKVKQ
jgi:molecular chaperone GrpE